MSQNFKKIYNRKKFINILVKYCLNEKTNEFIFTQISYKKMIYNKILTPFLNDLHEYYHKSKQFYLKREMTYKNLLTIIRQIMNSLCIPYTSKIIYNKSKYSINYIIFLDDEMLKENVIEDLSSNSLF